MGVNSGRQIFANFPFCRSGSSLLCLLSQELVYNSYNIAFYRVCVDIPSRLCQRISGLGTAANPNIVKNLILPATFSFIKYLSGQ